MFNILRGFTLAITCFCIVSLNGCNLNYGTLGKVKQRGMLHCGVEENFMGFSHVKDGQWNGFDVDFCRAIAVAVLGDAGKVKYVPINSENRFKILSDGKIDVIARSTTWTFDRDARVDFAAINFYDKQALLVKDRSIKSIKDLNDHVLCALNGTTTLKRLSSIANHSKQSLKELRSYASRDSLEQDFISGHCDALSMGVHFINDFKQKYANQPIVRSTIIVPISAIANEPYSIVVRQDDSQWEDIVRWTVNAMIVAEGVGLSQNNIDSRCSSASQQSYELAAFCQNTDSETIKLLGLKKDFAHQIIKQVGNYADVYERNFGSDSKRGLNQIEGEGKLYVMPFL